MTGIPVIINIINNVFDLLFPNVFKQGVTTIDGILENNLLGSMVADILKSLGTSSFSGATNGTTINGRGVQIANVALPVVCMILGLSDAQSFKELENYMPSVISASDDEASSSTTAPAALIPAIQIRTAPSPRIAFILMK